MFLDEWCIHVANLFYLASFLGRDMLWLRVLTCFGLAFGVIFFTTCTPTPLYGPTFWHVTFLVINIVQIHLLLVERRRLRLSREQEVVRRAMLEGLTDQELVDTLAHAVMTDNPDFPILTASSSQELTADELAIRDIAFSRLSRAEIINLLSRRVWNSLEGLRGRHGVGSVC